MNYKVSYVDERPDEGIEADGYSVPDLTTNTSAWTHFYVQQLNIEGTETIVRVRSIRDAEIKTIALNAREAAS
jgi:hypothetical protein